MWYWIAVGEAHWDDEPLEWITRQKLVVRPLEILQMYSLPTFWQVGEILGTLTAHRASYQVPQLDSLLLARLGQAVCLCLLIL